MVRRALQKTLWSHLDSPQSSAPSYKYDSAANDPSFRAGEAISLVDILDDNA